MKPLNIFQRCIRVWEETHPYNAAQILLAAQAPQVGRCDTSIHQDVAMALLIADDRQTGVEDAPPPVRTAMPTSGPMRGHWRSAASATIPRVCQPSVPR